MNTNYIAPNDYLVHYGVLGMKWGHRKQKPYNSMSVSQKQRYLEKQNIKRQSEINKKYRKQKKAVLRDARKQIKVINNNKYKDTDRNNENYYRRMGKVQSNKEARRRIVTKAGVATAGALGMGFVGLGVYQKTGSLAAANAVARIGGYTIGSVAGYSIGRDLSGIIGNKMNNKKKK